MKKKSINLSTGQKLWKRAKKVIPGGNMLLSKRSEMFLPEKWPAYFSKSKGCNVWDLDGKKYIDMSIMGIGTNILGYGNEEVDKAVLDVVNKGNMSTLNCEEEVLLAERLIELHPWSKKVRLARTGGEANAIAVRIARAATGKEKIAICGYHGWHDWYLATNLSNTKNLNDHLLPGLSPEGVPQSLRGSVVPFTYNNFEQLEKIVANNKLAAVKMEVQRSNPPKKGFLESVRRICDKEDILLIFDECTSGFRETFGGLHKKYEVYPDISIFGKALGNGYAITAIIGKEDVMEFAQNTFISSTFWTERIGPAAALKTLEIMEREKSWNFITSSGILIKEKIQKLADKYNLDISHFGIPSLGSYSFNYPNKLAYKTLITQEMLKCGYLASTICYVCINHERNIIEKYIENLDKVFSLICDCENGRNVYELLDGPICHDGFKRLN